MLVRTDRRAACVGPDDAGEVLPRDERYVAHLRRQLGHRLEGCQHENESCPRHLDVVDLQLVAVHRCAMLDLDPEVEVELVAKQVRTQPDLQIDEASRGGADLGAHLRAARLVLQDAGAQVRHLVGSGAQLLRLVTRGCGGAHPEVALCVIEHRLDELHGEALDMLEHAGRDLGQPVLACVQARPRAVLGDASEEGAWRHLPRALHTSAGGCVGSAARPATMRAWNDGRTSLLSLRNPR